VFGFATLWKLAAGHYLNGTFMYVMMLIDPRLQSVGAAVAGWQLAEAEQLRGAIGYLGSIGDDTVSLVVGAGPRLHYVSVVLCLTAVATEWLVGIAHLAPVQWLRRHRRRLLLCFCLGTYYLIPVPGFAFTLCILTLVQVEQGDAQAVKEVLITLAALQLMIVPWQPFLTRFLGRQ
jgi:hypothetical protein